MSFVNKFRNVKERYRMVLKKCWAKCPVLVDPSHCTSDPLPVHFQSTSGPLGTIVGQMRCPIIQFYKKK